MKEKISVSIEKDLVKRVDSLVDSVTVRNRSQALEHLIRTSLTAEVKQAVILCGTNIKAILGEVEGVPLIRHTIKTLARSGIAEILIAAADETQKIFSEIGDGSELGAKIIYLQEKGKMGTAGAVKLAKRYINSTFLVVSGDEYFDFNLSNFFQFHKQHNAIVTMSIATVDRAESFDKIDVDGSSIVSFEYMPKLIKTNTMNAGVYLFDPTTFDVLPNKGSLEENVFPQLAKTGKLFAYKFSGKWKHYK